MKKSILNFALAALTAVMTIPATAQTGSIRIGAHRGFWKCDESQNTENSIASLKTAQDYNLWGSEFDIHLTSDHEVVVHHDANIEGHDIQKNTYGFTHAVEVVREYPESLLHRQVLGRVCLEDRGEYS